MIIDVDRGLVPVDADLAAGMAADVMEFLRQQSLAGAQPADQLELGFPETPALYAAETAEADPPTDEERAEAALYSAALTLEQETERLPADVQLRRPRRTARTPRPPRAPRYRPTTARLKAAADMRPDLKPFPYGSGE